VVEGSLAWLVGCPRVQVRDERHADILLGFVHLACVLSCHKVPEPSTGMKGALGRWLSSMGPASCRVYRRCLVGRPDLVVSGQRRSAERRTVA
jgi:hypothetical protein